MEIKKLLSYLETIAPPMYQESYDNAGLIVGDPGAEIKGVLLCLDSTEEVVDEAIELGCNLIVAHHPIVFKGLKKLNGKNYVERVVIKAIKNDIAIYAIHTNLDNVYHQGVNAKIAEQLGLQNTRILAPKGQLKKMVTYLSADQADKVRTALYEAGAGAINDGTDQSYATLGVQHNNGKGAASIKLEILFPVDLQSSIIAALKTSSNNQAVIYEVSSVENINGKLGSGMIGELSEPIAETSFLKDLKKRMKAGVIRYTKLRNKKVKTVAVCGGAGGFLLSHAIRQQADVFVTADYKYHEFFDADGKIVIADIGHYESEQYTIELLQEIIKEKFSIFAAHCTKVNTNPVKYL